MTVACSDFYFIELLSATPSDGYSVEVVTPGPYYVEVHFVGAGRDEPVWAYCLGQPYRADEDDVQTGQAAAWPWTVDGFAFTSG